LIAVFRVAAIALLVAVSPVRAAGPASPELCRLPAPLISLARALMSLPETEARVSVSRANTLKTRVEGLSEREVLGAIEGAGLQSLTGIALEIMSEGERLSHPGAAYSYDHLRSLLVELDNTALRACAQLDNDAHQEDQQSWIGGQEDGEPIDWKDTAEIFAHNPAMSAAAVVVLVFAVVGIMFAVDVTLRWIYALIYNRKICRVQAVLVAGDARMRGLIITLGRGGFRFHAINMEGMVKRAEGGLLEKARLEIDRDEKLDCALSLLYDSAADFRLLEPLTLKRQNAILAKSTVTPYAVRKSRGSSEAQTKPLLRATARPEADAEADAEEDAEAGATARPAAASEGG
jgi:hypothetical protein